MQAMLGTGASVVRSQSYYLDITGAGRDKGTFVEFVADHLNIPLQNVATIGDMQNDVAMFRKSGDSFAMGNANDGVKAEATFATRGCDSEGFATAIGRILAGAKG